MTENLDLDEVITEKKKDFFSGYYEDISFSCEVHKGSIGPQKNAV